jgi:hypothetical protein
MKLSNRSLPFLFYFRIKSRVFVLLLLALHSISCSFDTTQQPATVKLDLHQEKIHLWFPQQPVPTEQGLALRLQLPEGVIPQLSSVEGESMAMGRIPVQWQPADGSWQATLYLGACTEPQMQWRMHIPLEHDIATLPKRVTFTFWSQQ